MNSLKKVWQSVILVFYGLASPFLYVYADGTIINPIHANTVQEFIGNILTGVIRIGMPVVALAIIYSGFLFVSARGNTEKLTKAKSALLYTIIGAGILLGSWAIAQIISDTALAL